MHERDAAPMLERGVASSIIDLFPSWVRGDNRRLAAEWQPFLGTGAVQERSGPPHRDLWIAVHKAPPRRGAVPSPLRFPRDAASAGRSEE